MIITGVVIPVNYLFYTTVRGAMQQFGPKVSTQLGPGSSSPFPPSHPRVNLFLTSNTSGTNLVVHLFPSAFGFIVFAIILIIGGCILQVWEGGKVKAENVRQMKLKEQAKQDKLKAEAGLMILQGPYPQW